MTPTLASPPSLDAIRAQFPALSEDFVFFENAGGSQVPASVPQAIHDYMLSSYVQLGAGYAQSRRATELVDEAHAAMSTFVNGDAVGRIVLGPSTTALTHILAHAYSEILHPGDEVIVAETNHEANAGPWARLDRHGIKVRIWSVEPQTFECPLNGLENLLTERTRIVALPHVSNLLGQIVDVEAVCRLAHRFGAKVVADGVAFAPHRAIDVEALGVDWYVFSAYKVFGPHMAVLFGRHEAFAQLTGPNHFFIPRDSLPYKFELGGISHEACAGLLAVRDYLAFLGGEPTYNRRAVEAAFQRVVELELPLQERLLRYLAGKSGVQVIGPAGWDDSRACTVSFVSERVASDRITAHTDAKGIGIRHGHMYAYRLCQALGIPPEPGVVRVSMLHYNTLEEVDRLIGALDEIL